MRATNPANSDDIQRMLGDVDPLIAQRILATGATADEIGEALREVEDEHGFGEATHFASSPRVAEVRALLDELEILDEESPDELEPAP
jgi:hypothetical protein